MAVIVNGTLVNTLIPAVSGLVGVAIGGWLTALNQKRERREAHTKSQLSNFYSPLLGIRSQIKAKSELRVRLSSVANAAWSKKFVGVEDHAMLKKEISERDGPTYDKLLDYNTRQLTEEIIPLYRKMLSIFTENMWLAETSTRHHYVALVEFVEMWDRFLDQSLPREVLQQIERSERTLQPLYDDLEHHLSTLNKRLH